MNRITSISFVLAALCTAPGVMATSPYIAKVHDYHPAPGQFVNEIPEYEQGDTYEDMLAKAEEQLCGAARKGMVTLGAFGGYVTFSFDHRVANKPGEYDFRVNGNAIVSDRDRNGGSCEPGIILVSVDANDNGLPDDEWYEIKGSEYDSATTMHGYAITYYRPEDGHQATPDPNDRHVIDTRYIRWTSNEALESQGYLQRNDSHVQDYWPMWLDSSQATLEFSGERLAPNGVDISGDRTYYLLMMLGEGYADNMPSVEKDGLIDPGVKIDWAVRADGTPAQLDGIDFVRVYTAINQTCGWIGETSTEVTGAEDLHPDYLSAEGVVSDTPAIVLLRSRAGVLELRSGYPTDVDCRLVSLTGAALRTFTLRMGDNCLNTSGLPQGIYLLMLPDGRSIKVCI